MNTKRRTRRASVSKAPRGPNGEKLCRNCLGQLPKLRLHTCSKECSWAWQCKTHPRYLRLAIERRDKGICALCGLDTVALKREYKEFCAILKAAWKLAPLNPKTWEEKHPWLQRHGIPYSREPGRWWVSDLFTPVIEVGCELDGYRTLCIPCHKVAQQLRRTP